MMATPELIFGERVDRLERLFLDSEWTLDGLKQYVDQRFAASELAVDKAVQGTSLAVDKAFIENQRAIDKADRALSTRLEGMTEQLSDQARQFAASHDSLKETVNGMSREQVEFRASLTAQVATLTATEAALSGKLDVLLDPQAGIYSKQGADSQHLKAWAIAILTALLLAIVVGLISIGVWAFKSQTTPKAGAAVSMGTSGGSQSGSISTLQAQSK